MAHVGRNHRQPHAAAYPATPAIAADSQRQRLEKKSVRPNKEMVDTSRTLAAALLRFVTYRKSYDGFKQKSLTPSDYKERVHDRSFDEPQMIWFYAHWCGHCTAMKPAWNEAVNADGRTHRWHVVDCSKRDNGLTSKFGVKSFPTIVKVHKGRHQIFKGTRKARNLQSFASA